MKPIKNKEIVRIALERFFKSWGFDVPSYETDEKGNTFFNVGERKCFGGFNSKGDFVLYLIDTFKNEYIEYTEAIIFSYNANKPRKLLTPKIAIIYKQPEIQALYIIAEGNHKKGEIVFETHCMCGGGNFTQNLDYLPFSSDIPEFQAYMEQHIGG